MRVAFRSRVNVPSSSSSSRSPQPYRPSGVETWVGGVSDVALRRTARFGTAWQPHLYGAEPGAIRSTLAKIRELQVDYDRTDVRIPATMFLPIELSDTDDPDLPPPWECRYLKGTADLLRHTLSTFADVGVEHVLLAFGGDTQRKLSTMDRVRDEVLGEV